MKQLGTLNQVKPETSEKPKQISEESNIYLTTIRLAKDMDTILNCPIIFNFFEIIPNEEDTQKTSNFILLCKCCTGPSQKISAGINIKDPHFKHEPCGKGDWQPSWFTNLKQILIRHVTGLRHEENAAEYAQRERQKLSSRQQIAVCMRHLSYFAAKTAMPFSQFSQFLATVNRCGVELGNINHSKWYITEFTLLLDNILKVHTEEWLLSENEVTLTLDIGTCLGISLLAVLLIKGPEVRLMRLTPIPSKKGAFLAKTCVDSLQSNAITLNILREKIAGVVGDGAFIKGNVGFKDTMKDLLHENLQFRWDILHLANRAHLDARGTTAADLKEAAKTHEDDETPEASNSSSTPISKLIDMIQKSAKNLRSGINHIGLKFLQLSSVLKYGVQLACLCTSLTW